MKTLANLYSVKKMAGMSILLILINFPLFSAGPEKLSKVKDLNGTWKFSIGERKEWVSPDFDDGDWELIKVPSPWEEQGFHGYNGFGFYRKTFVLDKALEGRSLYLVLGYIDDVDETYLNGKKIGSTGSMPPNIATAYNAKRVYYIPENYLHFGEKNTSSN